MRPLFAAVLLATATSVTMVPAAAEPVRDATMAALPQLTALYRELHAAPELSRQEVKSAARMAAEARKAGFTVTTGVGGTGVLWFPDDKYCLVGREIGPEWMEL